MDNIEIVGFSVRNNIYDSAGYSVDDTIWDENRKVLNAIIDSIAKDRQLEFDENSFLDSNGLIPTLSRKSLLNFSCGIPQALLIAIGYPEFIYNHVEEVAVARSYNVKKNKYKGTDLRNLNWRFIGYDIADIELHSLLKHCPPKEMHKKVAPFLNDYGLIDDVDYANKVSKEYEDLREDHKPFFPTAIFANHKVNGVGVIDFLKITGLDTESSLKGCVLGNDEFKKILKDKPNSVFSLSDENEIEN